MSETVAVQRCSDADRERTSARLRDAAAAGYLTMDEVEERLTGVYAARYDHELDALVADLPRSAGRGRGTGWFAVVAAVWTQVRLALARLIGASPGRRRLVVALVGVVALLAVAAAVVDGLELFEGAEGAEAPEDPDTDDD